ncbi:mitochondrial inner membrane protein required for protein import [Fusarium irregulare]|uniref:Mitochondrial import inner membrane translocase subunit TIM50 n=1 Tax=Fusarium irregulare TaxID=2494466 RepID=A0A9W8UB27_9HYPO|nr:mitochondrial inner membrane protein required for protein import [Fusarium irregulare]KAJ4015802.1 mitochondrial inner membrane protein required for protein import [Fusarium irregulare]
MLSRVAQASRLGLMSARLSQPVASPPLRAIPATAPHFASPWLRSYSKRPSGQPPKDSKKKPSEAQQEAEAAKAAEKSAEHDVKKADGESPEAPKEGEQIPFHKLPDLTQGIPSTLFEEMGGDKKKEQQALQELEEAEQKGGERDRSEYVSTSERNRKWWTRFMLITTAAGGTLSLLYMGRNWEDNIDVERHPDIPNGPAPGLWWARAKARMTESVTYYQEPAFEKLLPDPDPTFERPYTLCLSLDDLLIHSEWTREHGWRVAKRPGVDYFIRYLSQYYELVLFTSTPYATGEPVMRKLDPFRLILWPLYREATKFENGEIVKDLSYLNRDLSKVIIIDTKAKHVRNQPDNAIVLPPWKGDRNDKGLVNLIPFLEYIHTMQYDDVRKVIKSFEGKDIPTEFARREAIARKEFQAKQLAHKHKHRSGVGALGNMLGLNPSNMNMMVSPDGEQNPAEAFAQGKMLQDVARERGQRNYMELEKQIRENGEKWLKEEAAMMEAAQKEAMSSMMGSFGGWFGGNNPPEKKA